MPFPLGNLQLEELTAGPDPTMTPEEAKKWWRYKKVARDFKWISPDKHHKVLVKAGRFLNGASIPGFFGILWWILGTPFGPFCTASAVHDQLYYDGENRGMADNAFSAVAQECPAVKMWKRRVATGFLLFFGWYTWRRVRGRLFWNRSKP